MKQKYNLIIYSCIWVVAVIILVFSLFQNMGDAKVINYSGIIRGATQKLIKEELSGNHDDQLILQLDEVLYDLQTGEGDFNLIKLDDSTYQGELLEIEDVWQQIKIEIDNVRVGASHDKLYRLSEEYFDMTNHMVTTAQEVSDRRSAEVIIVFVVYLMITIGSFLIWHRYKQKQIKKAMYIDELTGINNIVGFEFELQNRTSKSVENMALVYLDIDDFKYLNSVYGNTVGDQILKTVAKTIQSFTNGNGCCARCGNDEFILLCDYQVDIITQLKKAIQITIQEFIELNLYDDLSFCCGVYILQKEDNFITMIDNASLAHKRAKVMGQGSCLYYDEELLSKLYQESKLTKKMHTALKEKEFKLYLQPKFEVTGLKVVGAEALVRWHTKDGIVLFPDEFIPFSEKNASIYELDFYMLEQACLFLKEYHLENTDFRISVNFSRVTIYHQDFRQSIKGILNKYNIPVHCIELEITETAINDFSKHIITMLEELNKDGFILSMDDFGAGYSSLTSIHTIPVNIIKIDKRFLKETHQDDRVEAIMKFIVETANLLGKEVICEGVEVVEDIELLERIQCPLGQGYFVSKPIYQEEFIHQFLINTLK